MKAKSKPKADPELIRQIQTSNDDRIEAVFSLDLPMKELLDPSAVEQTASRILRRAEEVVGHKAHAVNVFKNMGSFIVSGDGTLIERIIEQPEIAKAVANRVVNKKK